MASRLHTPEESAVVVARLRAEGKIPAQGQRPAIIAKSDPRVIVQVNSKIGDCLKASFEDYAIEFSPGCSCRALQEKLNRTRPEDIENEIDAFVDKVASNVQHAKGWKGAVLKAINWAAPDEVKSQIREILVKCVAKSKAISETQTAT